MKIVIYEVEAWEKEAFESLEGDHDLIFLSEPLSNDNVHADADIISTFIYSNTSAEILKQFKHLKLVATRSTGFDHIDTDYCQSKGITLSNVPDYGCASVAEHVFALLLAISHNLIEAADRTRRGDFSHEGLQGFDLRGKVLGVVGTGAIGRCVVEIAKGFRMEVIAFDVKTDPQLSSELGFRYVDMDELLATSDIITLHVPGNEKNRHLLAHAEFAKMKNGVVVINTARGNVIDVSALMEALSEGKVRAAGLDVLPEEPIIREEGELLRSVYRQKHDHTALLADHILLRLRNVIITPHTAFDTYEAVQRILEATVDNIRAFMEGRAQNTAF